MSISLLHSLLSVVIYWCCCQETYGEVDFKIKPILIPSAAIKKLEQFPHCSGGLGDVWKCSMSTPSGMRRLVSFQTGGRLSHYLLRSRLLSNPSGSPNPTIEKYYVEQAGLEHESVVAPLADNFFLREFVARPMFGCSCHTIIFSPSRVLPMTSDRFLH